MSGEHSESVFIPLHADVCSFAGKSGGRTTWSVDASAVGLENVKQNVATVLPTGETNSSTKRALLSITNSFFFPKTSNFLAELPQLSKKENQCRFGQKNCDPFEGWYLSVLAVLCQVFLCFFFLSLSLFCFFFCCFVCSQFNPKPSALMFFNLLQRKLNNRLRRRRISLEADRLRCSSQNTGSVSGAEVHNCFPLLAVSLAKVI